MKKENVTQHTIKVKNEAGALNKATEVLDKAGIRIRGISAQAVGEATLVRILTDAEGNRARRALEDVGYEVAEHPCFRVELPNRPGEFSRLCAGFADQDINILGAYGTSDGSEHVKLVVAVDQPEKAAPVFGRRAEAAAPAR